MTALEEVFDRQERLARQLAVPLSRRQPASGEKMLTPAFGQQGFATENAVAKRWEAVSASMQDLPAATQQQTLPEMQSPYMSSQSNAGQPFAETQTTTAQFGIGSSFSPIRNELADTLSRAFERDARRY